MARAENDTVFKEVVEVILQNMHSLEPVPFCCLPGGRKERR